MQRRGAAKKEPKNLNTTDTKDTKGTKAKSFVYLVSLVFKPSELCVLAPLR